MARMKEEIRLLYTSLLDDLEREILRSQNGEMNRRELLDILSRIELADTQSNTVNRVIKDRKERLLRLCDLELRKSTTR